MRLAYVYETSLQFLFKLWRTSVRCGDDGRHKRRAPVLLSDALVSAVFINARPHCSSWASYCLNLRVFYAVIKFLTCFVRIHITPSISINLASGLLGAAFWRLYVRCTYRIYPRLHCRTWVLFKFTYCVCLSVNREHALRDLTQHHPFQSAIFRFSADDQYRRTPLIALFVWSSIVTLILWIGWLFH